MTPGPQCCLSFTQSALSDMVAKRRVGGHLSLPSPEHLPTEGVTQPARLQRHRSDGLAVEPDWGFSDLFGCRDLSQQEGRSCSPWAPCVQFV